MTVSRLSRAHGRTGLWLLVAGLCLSGWAAWADVNGLTPGDLVRTLADGRSPAVAPRAAEPLAPVVQKALVWHGADIDGDGQEDFINPTGKVTRTTDAYGCGAFGADRDAGERRHEGVDYDSTPGQRVKAPISGFVTRIGYAYADDHLLQFVEITNPALRYETRAFYVVPVVHEGQPVRLGQTIGYALSLQKRYPGITNHVHLEIARLGRARIDATRLITARWETQVRALASAETTGGKSG